MTIVIYNENMENGDEKKNNFEKAFSTEFSSNIPVLKEEYVVPLAKDGQQQDTFQGAMKLCILIGQCFGVNPVLGVCEKDTSKLRFSVYSVRFLYTLLTIIGQTSIVCLCVVKLAKDTNSSLSSNSSLVFYGTNSLTTIVFLRIAMKWPKLCQQISKLETTDPNMDSNLVKKCNVTCIVVLSLALIEHLLSDMCGIVLSIDCQPDINIFQAFAQQGYSWAWKFFDYNHYIAVLVLILNFQCTFNWSFADTFVICISWYLSARLKQVNDRIVAARGKYVSASFWRSMREDWCKATTLVRNVDDTISSVIFISFANNLFFICVQFLNILDQGIQPRSACDKPLSSRPLKGLEQSVYFLYSLGFLLARSISVSLIAAKVHTASKLPTQSLYTVPSSSYSIEVQRFIDQVNGDTIGLSGLQFFHVKRGLLLTVAGTIVTYELVLMQFAGVSPTSSPPLAAA